MLGTLEANRAVTGILGCFLNRLLSRLLIQLSENGAAWSYTLFEPISENVSFCCLTSSNCWVRFYLIVHPVWAMKNASSNQRMQSNQMFLMQDQKNIKNLNIVEVY